MKKLISLLLMQLLVLSAFGQFTLKGVVTGNENLAGASVVVKNTFYGTSTNATEVSNSKTLKKAIIV